MKRPPCFLGSAGAPPVALKWLLAALPFFVLLLGYLLLAADDQQRLVPTVAEMASAMQRAAFTRDISTGEYQLWADTGASLQRLGLGLGAAALGGMLCGVALGLWPFVRYLFRTFLIVFSLLPALALLPLLFFIFGVEELAGVLVIFLGTFPLITREVACAVQKIPPQQLSKALTLGASRITLVSVLVLPLIVPRWLGSMRRNLGLAWLLLLAAEPLAALPGLGYRIFLARRELALEMIIPYVLWIGALVIGGDWLLRAIVHWKFSWYLESQE